MKNKENGFINYIFKSACFGFDMHCAPLFCILITQEEEGQGYHPDHPGGGGSGLSGMQHEIKTFPSPSPKHQQVLGWGRGRCVGWEVLFYV